MKVKITINGKEIEAEISQEELNKLQPAQKKKTGYEMDKQIPYPCYIDRYGEVDHIVNTDAGLKCYETANYYSSLVVAKNNARADQLMRQLRRFAVEHREQELNWNDSDQSKYFIYYKFPTSRFDIAYVNSIKRIGEIYFDSPETAQLAIDTFHDELIWYFTEYKDSL